MATLLHKAGPVPGRLEYDSGLLDGLARGQIRRRGLFIWNRSDLGLKPPAPGSYALLMTDRSGAAQLIDGEEDVIMDFDA